MSTEESKTPVTREEQANMDTLFIKYGYEGYAGYSHSLEMHELIKEYASQQTAPLIKEIEDMIDLNIARMQEVQIIQAESSGKIEALQKTVTDLESKMAGTDGCWHCDEMKAKADKLAKAIQHAMNIKDVWCVSDIDYGMANHSEAQALLRMEESFKSALSDYKGGEG